MYFDVDPKFRSRFCNLKQVFLYVTDECNLRCKQCLYKPNLAFHLKEKEIELDTALHLISDFREMGASKLTIMGGEPTLYGADHGHKPLLKLISEAKALDYQYIRIDSNGQFEPELLQKKAFTQLDEITFSLDGFSPEINDPVRGEGSFEKCVLNIRRAKELGYNVDITSCIHKGFLVKDAKGNFYLDLMIRFAESLKVGRINFHDLFKTGIPRDVWTDNIDLSLEEWLEIYSYIQANIDTGKYQVPVRIPQCFVSKEEFESKSSYYGYCPVKLGERVLAHPNGIIRICSLLIGSAYGIARFYDGKIILDETSTNELRDHKLDTHTPCTNQNKTYDFGDFVPLCVSFKPRQKEMVWENLKWEEKRIN